MKRRIPGQFLFPFLAVLLGVLAVLGVLLGETPVSGVSMLRVLGQTVLGLPESENPEVAAQDQVTRFIGFQVRLPRVLLAILIGAGLAVSGAVMQGLFHNPMAEPGILGVSSGGAFGGVLVMVLGLHQKMLFGTSSVFVLPILAFIGAAGAAFLVYGISTHNGRTPIATLLLAGIAVNTALSAGVSFLITATSRSYDVAPQVFRWLVGGIEARGWQHVGLIAPTVIVGGLLTLACAKDLDLLLLGEETAMGLGVDVVRFKILSLTLVSVITGSCVAVSGVIGFVGLIVPHMVRLVLGPKNRLLLPASLLAGACFLSGVDLVGRVFAPSVQLGVLTSLLGSPFFLYLLVTNRKKAEVF